MHTCFPKLYTVKEEWEKAKTICHSDGGALISILTQDDNSTMNYYSALNYNANSNGIIWIGLRKTEATLCWDGTCDGKLRWQNGNTFLFDPLIHNEVLVDSEGKNCFRVVHDKQNVNDRSCNHKSHFLCQIACPGESKFIKII